MKSEGGYLVPTTNEGVAKDVQQGFSLPVLPDLFPNLAQVMVQQAGVVKQFSL